MKKIYLVFVSAFITIAVQAQCLVTVSGTNVQCNGTCDGTATATPVGIPPYSYLWMPGGMTTQSVSGLCAGTYTVNVVDGTSCTSSNTITITEPSALSANTTVSNISCNGACDGSATAFVSGGTTPYTHSWSDSTNSNSAIVNNLCPGTYYDTISDANGCTTIISPGATITEPAVLMANVTCSSVSCFGGSNGTAMASQSGGTAPYTYSWSTIPTQTTQTISGLSPGTYSCTVTDANGCSSTENCTVNQPASALSVTATGTDASCSSCCDGSAMSSATGGTAGYTYMWSPGGQTTSTITGICPGNYTVCVTDANGCMSCDSISVNFSVGINESSLGPVQLYPNPTSGDFEIVLNLPASTQISFIMYDVIGNEIRSEVVSASGTFKKKFTLQAMPSGVYFLKTGVWGKYTTSKIIKY